MSAVDGSGRAASQVDRGQAVASTRSPADGEDAAPVIVVGSGPAGVAVAEGLLRRGRRVLLIESGGHREEAGEQDPYGGGPPRGVWGHEPLGENRRRMIGGTSTAWGGRCVPLDPVDFERRAWVPDSGWPITWAEYARWLPEASTLLEIPPSDFHRHEPDPILTRDADIDGTPIELWSPPTDVSHLLARLEADEPGLQVLRGTHVTGLDIDDTGRVRAVLARRHDAEVRLEGERVVLAAGALENARLLLCSSIAHRLPAVGRFYMSHVFASHIAFQGPPLPKATGFFRVGRTYARHRWQLTPAAQERLRVGNVIGFMARPPAHRLAVHLDPLSALVQAAKLGRRVIRSPRSVPDAPRTMLVYARVLLKAPPIFWSNTIMQAVRRRARHRLPMLLPPRSAATHHLTVQAEHLPHADSRVVLSAQRDRYGVPMLEADIDFHRTDFETVEAFFTTIADFLERHGYRAVVEPRAAAEAFARDMYGGFNSNAHHIGTARMGEDPATSVVDADCRVHGTPNLWVAGAAVFPTSGHANPTLSIVALACRLAAHLADR